MMNLTEIYNTLKTKKDVLKYARVNEMLSGQQLTE
jgi:hypothetical protein